MSEAPHYEYRWEDHSLLTRYLHAPLFVPLVRSLPRRITPNMVTVFGHAAVWLTFVVALSRAQPGAWIFAALGVSYLTYALADCIDGMFARHTGRTSRLGELLDHGFDAISLPLVSLGIGIATRLPAWLILSSTAAVAFMVFATFVHGYRVGYVVLGAIGSLEGIVAAGVVGLAIAVFGIEPFTMPVLLGLSIAGWLAIAIVGGSFLALLSMRGLIRYPSDFAALFLLCGAVLAWYRFGQIAVAMAGLLFVAVCAYEVCVLTCSRLLHAPLRLWDIGLLTLLVGGAALSVALRWNADAQAVAAGLVPAYVLARGGRTFAHAVSVLRAERLPARPERSPEITAAAS
jgi:phosphatidylglycerophosphate synthase